MENLTYIAKGKQSQWLDIPQNGASTCVLSIGPKPKHASKLFTCLDSSSRHVDTTAARYLSFRMRMQRHPTRTQATLQLAHGENCSAAGTTAAGSGVLAVWSGTCVIGVAGSSWLTGGDAVGVGVRYVGVLTGP